MLREACLQWERKRQHVSEHTLRFYSDVKVVINRLSQNHGAV